MAGSAADPFGTSALRSAVLNSWAASPARFREDANAEEALATGGYAGRLLIELAANALDAAKESGVVGRVRFTLDLSRPQAELRAANVGAPLSAAGVSGLASLRASAKRGASSSVGHFGVGFTAVMAVSDEPALMSSTGGVRFSRSATAAAIADLAVPELDGEVAARDGQVPTLRLPWTVAAAELSADPLPAGFDSQVRLPLRVGLEVEVAGLLAELGEDLLWALPGLMVVEVDLADQGRRTISRQDLDDGLTVISDGASSARYLAVSRAGTIPSALLAERPVEERGRDHWQMTWVLAEPVDEPRSFLHLLDPDALAAPSYLGAPTPTDEPLSLPARLVGTFPVDDTRRRLAKGALTHYLLDQAAAHYLELMSVVRQAHLLSLVPTAGFPLGPVDDQLRQGIIAVMSRSPVLISVAGEALVPSAAVVVTGISDEAAVLLGRAVPDLLLPPRSPGQLQAMRTLGVVVLPLADAVGALAAIEAEPSFWREVYRVLADANAEDLANLPVPLAGGGRRIGPAGTLLPDPALLDVTVLRRAAAIAPNLALVHPEAAHPLLSRLGALPADAQALLADPALIRVFREFREDLDDQDPDIDELEELAVLALDLASASGPAGGLLEGIVLTDAAGEAWPAAELLAPAAALAAVLAADADLPVIGARWAEYPEHALTKIGVRTGLRIVSVQTVDDDLPDLAQWWSEVVGDSMPPETFAAIADLDLIDETKWPEALAMIAADPVAVQALAAGPDPSYSRWWISQFAVIAGAPPTSWRLPGVIELAGLYDEIPVELDPVVAAAIGVLGSPADAVSADPDEFLARMADPAREVGALAVPQLTLLVVEAVSANRQLALPAGVRTLSGEVVEAADAMVLDLPWLAQVLNCAELVSGGAGPGRVASVLELDLASDVVTVQLMPAVDLPLSKEQESAAQRAALALGLDLLALFPAGSLRCVDGLSVKVSGSLPIRVMWWGTAGSLLTDGSPQGLGRAIAYRAQQWSAREAAIAAAVGNPLTLAENGLC